MCYLCGRPPTSANPVSAGMTQDVRSCWASGGRDAYIRLYPGFACPDGAINHAQCRMTLRNMGNGVAASPSTTGLASPDSGASSCAWDG